MLAALGPALVPVTALTGCGASRSPAAPPADGRAVFASACAGCHTLSGADAARLAGGDLLHLRIDRGALLQFVAEMPVRRPLSAAQMRAVADYVLAVEAQGR